MEFSKASLKQLPFDVIAEQVEKRNLNDANRVLHESVVSIKEYLNGASLDETNKVLCGQAKVQKPIIVAASVFMAKSLETGKTITQLMDDATLEVKDIEVKN